MNPATQSALNSPALALENENGVRCFEDLFNARLLNPLILDGIQQYTEDAVPDFEPWLEASLETLAKESSRMKAPYIFNQAGLALSDYHVFRPLVINYNPRGVHFVDHLFGADVIRLDNGTWQAHPLTTPVGQLKPLDLETVQAWSTMRDFAESFLSRNVAGVSFALPTIASALNIGVNLYGEALLIALYDNPGAAVHDLKVINDTLCRLHRWYLDHIPLPQLQCIVPDGRFQPPGFGQICGCTTHLISGEAYAEFIAPLDDELLSQYPRGGMIHLCGRHLQHLPAWRNMKSLRAVQLNDRAAEDTEAYFTGLRDDQVLYVNPCPKMPADRILNISHGKRMVLVRP